MFYTIYKITNQINSKIYIGQHKTSNLDDGYMGSGTALLRAFKKYGEDVFTKEISHKYLHNKRYYCISNMEKISHLLDKYKKGMIMFIDEDWVDSSWIEDLELEQDGQDIILSLLSQRLYKVIGADEDVFNDWMVAPSKGKYFHQYIKDYYEIVRLFNESVTMNEAKAKRPEPGRKPDLEYKEKLTAGVVSQITVFLQKDQSGAFTRLMKRYTKILYELKLLENAHQSMNEIIRRKFEPLFDAEDETLTRVIETVTMTANLAKKAQGSEKFGQAGYMKDLEDKAAERKGWTGWEKEDPMVKYTRELEEAAGLSGKALEELRKSYTKFVEPPAKKAALRVKSKEPKESVTEGPDANIQSVANEVMALNDLTDDILAGIRLGE